MEPFVKALNEMRGARNLVLCHEHADSDSVGAAYGISRWIGGDIGVPGEVAVHARGLVEKLQIDIIQNPDPSIYTHVVLVDCASAVQLGSCMPSCYWLIDHHDDNHLVQGAVQSFYEPRSSTCQLVYRLLMDAGMQPDVLMATALCAGILTDTINFHKGDDESFRAFGELLQHANLTYDEIQNLYGIDQRNDRGAIIEAALRSRKFSFDGFHILATEIKRNIPTFAARALFDLGADVSVVGYQRDEDVEIRMYLRQEISDTYKIHADELFRECRNLQQTKVWGYQLFAGYRSKGNVTHVIDQIVARLHRHMKEFKEQP
ncbi:MAG: hypothetical protein JWN30_511 [Bacilli bacterium]|nr:hypothetical protein [Bacilli bacterium]